LRRAVRRIAVGAQDSNCGGYAGRPGRPCWSYRAFSTRRPSWSRITPFALRLISAARQADG
jgi:hypothetical protein